MGKHKFEKGKHYCSEKKIMNDERTGVTIWQMTDYPADHMNLYITKSSFTPHGENIVFLSRRNGWSNLFMANVESGEILQLTDYKKDIIPFSPCILQNGRLVYYSTGSNICSLNLSNLHERVLCTFPGSSAGSLHLSSDGKFILTILHPIGTGIFNLFRSISYFAKHPFIKESTPVLLNAILHTSRRSYFKLIRKKAYKMIIISTNTAKYKTLLNRKSSIGMSLFSPNSYNIAYFNKPESQLWHMDIDGKNSFPLYGHDKKIWLTHPVWLNDNEVIFSEWPKALKSVRLDGKIRTICEFNCWHPSVSPNGSVIVCDTSHPDTGIYLIDPNNGKREILCHSHSHYYGPQWGQPFAEPPVARNPFGNQWAHPHPSFSPDGKKVIFNSNKGGQYSQIYIALLEDKYGKLRQM